MDPSTICHEHSLVVDTVLSIHFLFCPTPFPFSPSYLFSFLFFSLPQLLSFFLSFFLLLLLSTAFFLYPSFNHHLVVCLFFLQRGVRIFPLPEQFHSPFSPLLRSLVYYERLPLLPFTLLSFLLQSNQPIPFVQLLLFFFSPPPFHYPTP